MLVSTERKFTTMLNKLRKGPAMTVYDLETTGLEPFKGDRLIGVAILIPDMSGKTTGESFYTPFRHKTGKNLPYRNLRRLAPFLRDPDRWLIGFNIKFDVHFTERERIGVRNRLMDVMLAAHLANENEMGFSLKRLGAKYISSDAARSEKDLLQELKDRKLKKGKGDMQYLPPEVVTPYAEQDVCLTWQLASFYTQNLAEQGIYGLWGEVNEYLEAVTAMERRGVLVDPEGCEKSLIKARRYTTRLYKEMKAIVGKDFNPRSVPQLRKILGQQDTDKKTLKTCKHPIAKLLVQNRSWEKAANSFYQVFLDKMGKDYRVHPDIKLHGTISGRLSCTKPNLQALPVGSTIYKVRDLVLAPPGYVLMSWDWSQVELRLLAHYTKDPFLIDAFKQNKDIHQETATGLRISRIKAKRTNFSIVYGIGALALAGELNISVPEAKEVLNRYNRLIPGVRRLYHTAQHIADRDHKIPLWTGRLRHYRKEDATHKAMSNLIQGGVAEMMRAVITRLHGLVRGTSVYMTLQIHDEILFEIPVGEVARWAVVIRQVMENFEFDVPIVAEGKIGRTWGADNMYLINFDKSGRPVIPTLGSRGT